MRPIVISTKLCTGPAPIPGHGVRFLVSAQASGLSTTSGHHGHELLERPSRAQAPGVAIKKDLDAHADNARHLLRFRRRKPHRAWFARAAVPALGAFKSKPVGVPGLWRSVCATRIVSCCQLGPLAPPAERRRNPTLEPHPCSGQER